MDMRGVSLTISDTMFEKYWDYDKGWWEEFLTYFKGLDYNTILFWPLCEERTNYNDVFGQDRPREYFEWLLEKCHEHDLKVFYLVGPSLLPRMSKRMLQVPMSYMLHCYDTDESRKGYRDFLEKLKGCQENADVIVRGYLTTPYVIEQAKEIFHQIFPDGRFWATRKYSFEHFAGVEPTLDAPLYSKAADGNLVLWFQTCADFDPFRAVAPAHVSACLKGCREAGGRGFIMHPPHWWTFPKTSHRTDKNPGYKRDFLWYQSFSKYAKEEYKPADAARWSAELGRRFGRSGPADDLYQAVDAAGRFLPTVSDLFWYSVDFQYHPQTASVFDSFVGPEIYSAIRPRHHQYPSIAQSVAAAPESKEAAPQVKDLSNLHRCMADAIAQVNKDALNHEGEAFLSELQSLAKLSGFWASYARAIELTYRFVGTGDNHLAKKAVESYNEAAAAYTDVASTIEADYKGFTTGIWDIITTWSGVIPEMRKSLDSTCRMIEEFRHIPACMVGDLLDRNILWYRQLMEWPFHNNGVDCFHCHQVLPYTVKSGNFRPDGLRLLIVQKDMAPLLPFKEEVLSWVKSGGRLLLYDIERNYDPGFLPEPLQLDYFSNVHIHDGIYVNGEDHPLTGGFKERNLTFIPDSNGIRMGPCSTCYGPGWKVLAIVQEEMALGTPALLKDNPAALLVLPWGKGEIAFSGIRVPHIQLKAGYPPERAEINSTVLKIAANWFSWAGIKTR
jgi:hypothetical protein